MASKDLIEAVTLCENYISANGVTEKILDSYSEMVSVAIKEEKDIECGLNLSKRVNQAMSDYILGQTGWADIWGLERFIQDENKGGSELLEKYYDIVLLESHHLFESFMLYMEKNRPYRERFYQPRIKPLQQVAQLIQDLYDDKLDEGMVFNWGVS